jgi:hypothetical protein
MICALTLRLVQHGPQLCTSRTSLSPSRSLRRVNDVASVFATSSRVSFVDSVPQLKINLASHFLLTTLPTTPTSSCYDDLSIILLLSEPRVRQLCCSRQQILHPSESHPLTLSTELSIISKSSTVLSP